MLTKLPVAGACEKYINLDTVCTIEKICFDTQDAQPSYHLIFLSGYSTSLTEEQYNEIKKNLEQKEKT